MEFQLDDSLEILRRTPATLDALLRGVPDHWVRADEGASTWSPFDVVGHLLHGEETDWIPRARIILEQGDARAFDPFDRFAQQEKSAGKTLTDLLDAFAQRRAENLDVLRRWELTAADMAKRGRHPELGSVTLGQLLATWTAHDLSHVVQISRVMCRQYTSAVGPWRAYLPILH